MTTSDRVHPTMPEPPAAGDSHLPESTAAAAASASSSTSVQSFHATTPLVPGTYVIRIPVDLTRRVSPAVLAQRAAAERRRRAFRELPRRLLFWYLLFFVAIAVAVFVGNAALYVVIRPKAPEYSIDSLSVAGLNLSGAGVPLSPQFDVAVRAENPDKKVSVSYRHGSYMSVSYNGVTLAGGIWPTFRQATRNVTVIRTVLTGSGLVLSSATHRDLVAAQNRGAVPLRLDLEVPVIVKFGRIWTAGVKARCDLTVDKLSTGAKIASKSCRGRYVYHVI